MKAYQKILGSMAALTLVAQFFLFWGAVSPAQAGKPGPFILITWLLSSCH